MKPNVFLSYSAETEGYARELAQTLESADIHTWAAFKDIEPGHRWSDELERAIGDCNWFVVLAMPDGHSSPYEELEWRRALSSSWENPQKKIMPVVFGTGRIAPFQSWVPLHVVDPAASPHWTDAIRDLVTQGANRSPLPGSGPGGQLDKPWTVEIAERPVAKL